MFIKALSSSAAIHGAVGGVTMPAPNEYAMFVNLLFL
jgi:hypothetical protein